MFVEAAGSHWAIIIMAQVRLAAAVLVLDSMTKRMKAAPSCSIN